MHNALFFISTDYLSFKEWPADSAKNIFPSILVEQSNAQQTLQAYRYCSSNTMRNFSISILVNETLEERFVNEVLSFLFIPGYYAINSKRAIILIGTDKELLQGTEKNMLEFSVKQGIENLVVNCVMNNGTTAVLEAERNTNYFFTDIEMLLNHYRVSTNPEAMQNSNFYLYNAQVSLQILHSKIREIAEEIKNTNPLLYKTMEELDNKIAENGLLKIKMAATETELNNYKSHLEILRSSHQAKELQEYYNGEYEVLPRWYKQFGHVIKVIVGKRSFRSLFTDKIKKSKD